MAADSLAGVVVHQHHVGGLDGGVAAQRAHGDAHIGAHQNRRVVDAVAHKGQAGLGGFGGQQLLHPADLVGGQQAGMDLVDAQVGGHLVGHSGAVAGQHDGAHALGLQAGNGPGRGGLELVGDQNRAPELPAAGHIHHGAHAVVRHKVHAHRLHQAGVAHAGGPAVSQRADALAGHLLHVGGAGGGRAAAGRRRANFC